MYLVKTDWKKHRSENLKRRGFSGRNDTMFFDGKEVLSRKNTPKNITGEGKRSSILEYSKKLKIRKKNLDPSKRKVGLVETGYTSKRLQDSKDRMSGKITSPRRRFGIRAKHIVDVSPVPIINTDARTLFIIFIYMMLLSSSVYAIESVSGLGTSEENLGLFGIDDLVDLNDDPPIEEFFLSNDNVRGVPVTHFGHDIGSSLDKTDYNGVIRYVSLPTKYKIMTENERIEWLNDQMGCTPISYINYNDNGLDGYYWETTGLFMSFNHYNKFKSGDWDNYEDENWWTGVLAFFGTITQTFGYVSNFLFFNFFSVMDLGLFGFLPFLMALPVWIYIGLLVTPYAIEGAKILASLLDLVIPDWL